MGDKPKNALDWIVWGREQKGQKGQSPQSQQSQSQQSQDQQSQSQQGQRKKQPASPSAMPPAPAARQTPAAPKVPEARKAKEAPGLTETPSATEQRTLSEEPLGLEELMVTEEAGLQSAMEEELEFEEPSAPQATPAAEQPVVEKQPNFDKPPARRQPRVSDAPAPRARPAADKTAAATGRPAPQKPGVRRRRPAPARGSTPARPRPTAPEGVEVAGRVKVDPSAEANPPPPRAPAAQPTVERRQPAACNSRIRIPYDAPYVFAAADFNFLAAEGYELAHVKIVSLAGEGSLRFDHDDVGMGQLISKAHIDEGKLTFIPATAWSGIDHDSFLFQVHDGESCSRVAYTMTIEVYRGHDTAPGARQPVPKSPGGAGGAPAHKDVPGHEGAPRNDVPASKEAPARKDVPARKEAPARKDAPARKNAPAPEDTTLSEDYLEFDDDPVDE